MLQHGIPEAVIDNTYVLNYNAVTLLTAKINQLEERITTLDDSAYTKYF